MTSGKGTATTCKWGHEKTGVRLQNGRQILYCRECSEEYRAKHIQRYGPKRRRRCRYGHELPDRPHGVTRRTCEECARISREAKERASVAA